MPAERPEVPSSSAPSVAAAAAARAAPGHLPPPPAAPSQRPTGSNAGSSALDEGGAKETVESILVAFILAFIFRAFIVEAFVIPTGSMAPTLMGAHMRFRCEDCGYRFDVNYTGRTVGDDVEIPSVASGKAFAAVCPNCGLKVARANSNDPDNDATAPAVHYGDRILVLKYAYLFNRPNRWDVVVFKSPDRSANERYQTVPPYTINYIKRLVGRPGESVFVLDGDVYVGKAGDRLEDHVVQTKPRIAQQALWRVVFDTDYEPSRADWETPWAETKPGTGWVTTRPGGVDGRRASGGPGPAAASRVLSFDNASGGGWLQFNPDAGADRQPLTDWLAYAVTKGQSGVESYDHGGLLARNVVADLKLAVDYERRAGTGPLRLQLSKFNDLFTAELTPGRVRLLRRDLREAPDADRELGSAALAPGAGPLHVEFTNVDYQVGVRINDRDVLKTTPEQYRPDVERLLADYRRGDSAPKPEVRVGAEGQTCALSHVSLWRDVYYTNRDYDTAGIKWGTPDRPMRLEADQYWVLGDNSLMSGDGRYWGMPVELPAESLEAQPGVVPGRFLLGKAFFVYWPAGHRPAQGLPGLVPNFGDMRFIH
jgi:signal peptidase I